MMEKDYRLAWVCAFRWQYRADPPALRLGVRLNHGLTTHQNLPFLSRGYSMTQASKSQIIEQVNNHVKQGISNESFRRNHDAKKR